jgi:hypothetical protein
MKKHGDACLKWDQNERRLGFPNGKREPPDHKKALHKVEPGMPRLEGEEREETVNKVEEILAGEK